MEEILRKWGGVEVSPMELYTDIFRLGEGFIQQKGEPGGSHKANPIIVGKPQDGEVCRRIMFEDTFEDLLTEFQDYEWAFLSGLTYWGKANTATNQSKMCAMIFDLDGQTPKTLNNFLSGALNAGAYPVPNYIALSGHGIHLYYVFEQPVSLYPNIKTQLKNLKYALTDKIWNMYTSTEKKVQHQGINQGFRIAGGRTKVDGVRVRVFRVNTTPVWFPYLQERLPKEFHFNEEALWRENKLTLAEAKAKYPDWYERRIVQAEKPGSWTVKKDLYNWWIRKIKEGATYGHRYFCIMCLAIYGAKCGLDVSEVRKDALALKPYLSDLNPEDPFTEADIESALDCCDERYKTFPRKDVMKLSGIEIPTNKRNYRKQTKHLQGSRAIRDINNENWREGNGRKPKQDLVVAYYAEHPTATVRGAAEALGISKSTVQKWKPKQ